MFKNVQSIDNLLFMYDTGSQVLYYKTEERKGGEVL